ncbi:MAG: hypothetical protein K0S32_521 [Bacteroidetes bacterium]|jgi:hypothetical protein|nr:hypothetical protein [Bacteroidota bacterium]
MKRSLLRLVAPILILLLISNTNTFAQALAGVYVVPSGTYPTINSIVTALNVNGISGPVTVDVLAGHSETAPVGGIHMTATGTAAFPIIFQKAGTGSDPIVNAFAGGTATPASATQNGIWKLIGCDYVTIDEIGLNDPNTTNNATMEYGFGLFKASSTNGCWNNTIRNCYISLNVINNDAGAAPSANGSRGIHMGASLYNSMTTNLAATSLAGTNSYNDFSSNIIWNCNIGIALVGTPGAAAANYDFGNVIGGTVSTLGNFIYNFGGAPAAANPAMGIYTYNQKSPVIAYNKLNNVFGGFFGGVAHPNVLYGIITDNSASAMTTISNNTITVKSGGTTQGLYAIFNNSGSGALSNSIDITDNVISNCTYAGATSGFFYGINNTATPGNLNITGNLFTGNSSNATTGTNAILIRNIGAVPGVISISSNSLSFSYPGGANTGIFYSIYSSGGTGTSTISLNDNNFSNYSFATASNNNIEFIYNSAPSRNLSISGNLWNNLTMNHNGAEDLIYDNSVEQNQLSISNNSIITGYTRTGTCGNMYCIYSTGGSINTSTQTLCNNNFSNITATTTGGGGNFMGVNIIKGFTSPFPRKLVYNNVVSNVTYNTGGQTYGVYVDQLGDGSSTQGSLVYNNLVSNFTGGTGINSYGLAIWGGGSPNYMANVYNNTVTVLSSTGGVIGAYLGAGGAGANFYKNKIAEITSNNSAANVSGLMINWPTSVNVFNNTIGNLFSPGGTGDNRIMGINIPNMLITAVAFIENNSVYLNATSTAATFGSSAFYTTTNGDLILRNNIFINNSTPKGTGNTVAHRRSGNSVAQFNNMSNKNVYYSGTPGANRLIGHNGTTGYSTLASWQTYVAPREAGSYTENTPFLSTTGLSWNFLQFDGTLPTLVQNNAIPLVNVTDDYINTVRNTTTPDIGAWEDNLLPLPIELLEFKGKCERSGSNLLEWTTSLEINADHFTVQKLKTSGEWEDIGKIDATNTSVLKQYSVNDLTVNELSSYYRLKQSDKNAKEKYSEIIVVNSCSGSDNEIEIYPNPTDDKLYVKFSSGKCKAELFNILGEKIMECELSSGENVLTTKKIENGNYIFRTAVNGIPVIKKVIVHH